MTKPHPPLSTSSSQGLWPRLNGNHQDEEEFSATLSPASSQSSLSVTCLQPRAAAPAISLITPCLRTSSFPALGYHCNAKPELLFTLACMTTAPTLYARHPDGHQSKHCPILSPTLLIFIPIWQAEMPRWASELSQQVKRLLLSNLMPFLVEGENQLLKAVL